jgi:ribitol-5-phosphate 2-dehydrogenase (NADP+) / D-ribitol-5-phosphate cytidylyltransferase
MINKAIILLSGSGIRFGNSKPKQFIELNGSPLFSYSLFAFDKNILIDEIILVVNPMYLNELKRFIGDSINLFSKPIRILNGGETRQISSFIGVSSIKDIECNVLIHDAVRPFIKHSIINECISKLKTCKAVSTVIPVSDTLYHKDFKDKIIDIPDRELFVRAQTPQGFQLDTILSAHQLAQKDKILNAPDDCYLVNKYHLSEIGLVQGDINNIKITYPIDIDFAETILEKYYEK